MESFYHSLNTVPAFWRHRLLLGLFRLSKQEMPSSFFLYNFLNPESDSLSFQQKVVLAGSSMNAVAAVKNLVYTGTCFLDKVP